MFAIAVSSAIARQCKIARGDSHLRRSADRPTIANGSFAEFTFLVDIRKALELRFQVRAAFETSKLSSSIWKRVTTSPVIVRMIANCVAMILPVALIRV